MKNFKNKNKIKVIIKTVITMVLIWMKNKLPQPENSEILGFFLPAVDHFRFELRQDIPIHSLRSDCSCFAG